MALDRIDTEQQKPSVIERIRSQQQPAQQEQPTETDGYMSELDKISEELLLLSQQNLTDAETKYRLSLIIATVREQNKILVNFLNVIRYEMNVMNNNQLNLLSEQEQYKKSVREEVSRSVSDIYSIVEARQTKAFETIAADVKKSAGAITKSINESTDTCKKASEQLEDTFRTSITIDNFLDFFYMLSPLSVILFVILYVINLFS